MQYEKITNTSIEPYVLSVFEIKRTNKETDKQTKSTGVCYSFVYKWTTKSLWFCDEFDRRFPYATVLLEFKLIASIKKKFNRLLSDWFKIFLWTDYNSLKRVFCNICEVMTVQKKNGKQTQPANYKSIKDLHILRNYD